MHLIATDYQQKYGSKRMKFHFDYASLKEIAKKGEGLQIEYKLKAKHPEKIVREIVAFANTKGGKLIIGIDDDGLIKGLKFAQEDEYSLINAIETLCKPAISYEILQTTLKDGREVLVFDIEASNCKPHFVIESSKQQTAYVRVNDRSVQASKEMCRILRAQNNSVGQTITIGPKESILLKFLEENNKITLNQYCQIAHIPYWQAARILVKLTLASVIQIHPGEQLDTYSRKL
jgi:predicted HTH transcriptional regulator